MATNTIEDFKGSDIIDVRDIIARVEDLREDRKVIQDDIEEISNSLDGTLERLDLKNEAIDALQDWNTDNAEELETLESLLSDLCGNGGDEQWEGDWYPVTLIRESHFEESMDEMIADCYDMPKNLPSFMTVTLDYDALKQDYTECEFEGDIYYYR